MADKQKLKCFGDANMSDACSQCPDNKECVEETVKRWRRRVNEEKSDKPCPFLTVQTYSTMKGEMKRHYCTARGLKDILPKTTWKNICLKGGICIIRQAQEWLTN